MCGFSCTAWYAQFSGAASGCGCCWVAQPRGVAYPSHTMVTSNMRVCFPMVVCVAVQVWDLKDAGLQAASRVAAASDPLGLLAEISQNFLSLVSSLTRQKVRPAWVWCCSGLQAFRQHGLRASGRQGMTVDGLLQPSLLSRNQAAWRRPSCSLLVVQTPSMLPRC